MKNPKAIAVCMGNGDLVLQYESGVVPSLGAKIHFAGGSYLVAAHDHRFEFGSGFQCGVIEEIIVTVEASPCQK